ncbi:MAG TPA: restriction endonuclease [Clostridia bacterium]|nr:restriction endonuclease [Clostridia bacterium]
MDSLRQRLKELDRDKFEDLVFMLLTARHPDANIRKVEGAGGDQGIDAFIGDLASGSTIWQAKSFPNGVKKSQREQIKKSLRTAKEHHNPERWILCVSTDMDIKAHEWFQTFAKGYTPGLAIGLMTASDIISELMHRDTIRNHYFPELGLSIRDLRALVTKTGECSDEELRNMTIENARQYIERLRQHDERFDYELVMTTDRPPKAGGNHAAFSVNMGNAVINAYARDRQALREDPIKLDVSFIGTGVTKIGEYIRTGRGTTFDAKEFTRLRTTLNFPDLQNAETLALGPRHGTKLIPTRLTIGNEHLNVVYDFINFEITSLGTEELTLTSTGKQPFTVTITIRNQRGAFNIDQCMEGAPIASVQRYAEALNVLQTTGELRLYDLEDERELFHAKTHTTQVPSLDEGLVRLIKDATIVAKAYDADIRMPAVISEGDAETIAFLMSLIKGTFTGINVITGTLIKEDRAQKWIDEVIKENPTAGINLHHDGITRQFGESKINTGPFDLIIEAVRFTDAAQVLTAYNAAPTGGIIRINCIPVGSVRAQRTAHPTIRAEER